MTQDQTRALVERLRAKHENWSLGQKGPPILLEAADALECQSRIIAAHEQQVKDGAELIERLQRALMFWMPGVDMRLDPATREIAAQDAHLLAGYTSTTDEPCWGDGILERALAAESSLKAAVEALEPFAALVPAAFDHSYPDSAEIVLLYESQPHAALTNLDFRRAAAAIRSRAAGGNET